MRSIIKWGCVCAVLTLTYAAGVAWGRYTAPTPTQPVTAINAPAETDALETFRTERQQLRQMQLNQLSEMIYSEDVSAEIAALAQQRQLELMEWSEQELTLEGILAMRDFSNAVATVHTDSVNVMIRAESISKQEAAVILELVMRETGISGGNVKIIPVN